MKARLVPLIISAILLVIKIYGFAVTGSLSILSSLLDSAMDLFMSSLNMVAIIYAAKPADDDHRFGHNSIEDIAGLIQASLIGASALFILYHAFDGFLNPKQISNNITGIWIMVTSLVATSVIVIYQKIIIRKTKSIVVEADVLHYLTDFLINGAIIISLILATNPSFQILDPILGALIAFYVINAALKIGKRSFDNLMDRELEETEKEKIKAVIDKNKDVKGYHELRTRRSGSRIFIQVHAELDKKLNLEKAHDIAEKLEEDIGKIWQEAEIMCLCCRLVLQATILSRKLYCILFPKGEINC